MKNFQEAQGKIKKNWLIGGIAAIVIIIGIIVIATRPHYLSGEYSHTMDALIFKSTDSMVFDKDKVTEYADGKKTNIGTYQLKHDQLEIQIGDTTVNATVSKDKQSFVIKSATGAAALAKGFKYTKKAK